MPPPAPREYMPRTSKVLTQADLDRLVEENEAARSKDHTDKPKYQMPDFSYLSPENRKMAEQNYKNVTDAKRAREALFAAGVVYHPGSDRGPVTSAPQRHTEREVTGRELKEQEATNIPCLISPLFQQVGLACLAGSSDTGKSAFLRQLSIAVSAGDTEFMGFAINSRHRSVIYVATEDSRDATQFFLHRQAAQHEGKALEGLRFIFEYEDILPLLDRNLTAQPADMIIVDCFSDAFGGDLKDTQKIRTYLNPYQQLAERHGCLVLFLHHTGKRTEALEPSKNNLLSGQGFEAKMRLVIELRSDPMHPYKRHLCIVKGNYLPATYKRESYVLEFDEAAFTFSHLGERVPFELLVRQADTDDSKAKYEQAKMMRDEGKTFVAIAEEMGYNSKTSILKLFDKAKKYGWNSDVSIDDKED